MAYRGRRRRKAHRRSRRHGGLYKRLRDMRIGFRL